ncbi:MAG: polymerase [Nocardioidaceae bacterium]|nr:polymerase [Nocardioidaceae bacterium]
MARFMVLWCPDWPVVAAMNDEDLPAHMPVAVFAKGQVFACSAAARRDGVRRDMRQRDAQSRCPDLVVLDHRPDVDARAFEAVLAAVEALSPGVSPIRPGLCALRVPARFYGGEAEAAAVIAERLVELGMWDCRAGIADGIFAAEQAARRAAPQDSLVVPAGESAQFLAALPIEIVDDPAMVSLLRRMGIRTISDFAALPARDVHMRFGNLGATMHRLARGVEVADISRRTPPPDIERHSDFEPPLANAESIAFSLRRCSEEFVAGLAGVGLVCTTLRIEVECEGSVVGLRTWLHPRWFSPTDCVDRVRWQLQADPAREPVSRVRLVPETVEPLANHADTLWGSGPAERIDRGLARVQSMVGHEAVVSPVVQGGRGPADRQAWVPWGDKAVALRPRGLPWPGSIPEPAPATVFAEPQEALVVGAEGQVIGVSGRGVVTGEPMRFRAPGSDRMQPVAAWAGPWPIDELWWDEAAARRIARFQVVGVDGSAWLMMVEDGRWWTEARYD